MSRSLWSDGSAPIRAADLNPRVLSALLQAGLAGLLDRQLELSGSSAETCVVLFRPELSVLGYLGSRLQEVLARQLFVSSESLTGEDQTLLELCSQVSAETVQLDSNDVYEPDTLSPYLSPINGKVAVMYVSLDGIHGRDVELAAWFMLARQLLRPGGQLVLSFADEVPANILVTEVNPALREFADVNGRLATERVSLELCSADLRVLAGDWSLELEVEAIVGEAMESTLSTVVSLMRMLKIADEDPKASPYASAPTYRIFVLRRF